MPFVFRMQDKENGDSSMASTSTNKLIEIFINVGEMSKIAAVQVIHHMKGRFQYDIYGSADLSGDFSKKVSHKMGSIWSQRYTQTFVLG